MSFPRYPEYKDSGVEWLGEVPAHWRASALRHLATLVTGITPPTDEHENYDHFGFPWIRPEDINEQNKATTASKFLSDKGARLVRKIPAESVLICCIGTIGKVGITNCIASTNQQVTAALFAGCKKFFYYSAIAARAELETASTGNVLRILNSERLGRIVFPEPPEPEQSSIAAFLDRETTKIDALVAEQQNLIALLKEKRQALISHAVTKGLDPDVPMKDSGVAWLGEVPAHWRVCAMRRAIAKIEQGWSPDCHARPAEAGEWGVLKAGCVNGGKYRPAENKALPSELLPDESYCVEVGDVLMSRASGSPDLVGSTALVRETPGRLMLSDKIFRIRLEVDVDPAFFVAMLNSRALRAQIEQALSGGNGLANNLPQSNLLAFICALPPDDEQVAIAAQLNRDIEGLDQLMAEAESTISLLIERRTALISAAVTGKIDVRRLAVASADRTSEPA